MQRYCGGSIGGAVKLNYGTADTVINWSGGLHHAKKAEVCTFATAGDIANKQMLLIPINLEQRSAVSNLSPHLLQCVGSQSQSHSFARGKDQIANSGRTNYNGEDTSDSCCRFYLQDECIGNLGTRRYIGEVSCLLHPILPFPMD